MLADNEKADQSFAPIMTRSKNYGSL